MDETMTNTEIEVTTEVSEPEEIEELETDITFEEEPSKPSKGFVTLVGGGLAALAIGGTIAFIRHMKKKAKKKELEEIESDPDFDDLNEEDNEEQPQEVKEVEETKKPTEKKGK